MQKINFSVLKPKLKSGDLIFFAGRSFFSKIISFLTKSKWTHVGMIVKIEQNQVYALFESDINKSFFDYRDGKFKRGVRLINLDAKIYTYKGDVCVKRLGEELQPHILDKLKNITDQLIENKYEFNIYALLASILKYTPNKSKKHDAKFCSELVAFVYQKLGLLNISVPAEWYTPADIFKLERLKGNTLSKPQLICKHECDHIDMCVKCYTGEQNI